MNRTRYRPWSAVLGALTLLLCLPGTTLADTTLRIGVQARIVHAVLALGVARGDFQAEGLTIELLDPSRPPLEALLDGELDLIATGADALLDAEQAGIALRGALLLGESRQADVLFGTPRMDSAAGLRGARVGLVSGRSGRLLLAAELQRRGLNLDGVELETVTADEALARWQSTDESTSLQAVVIAAPTSVAFEQAVAESMADAVADPDVDSAERRLVRLGDAADYPGLITDLLAGDERWLRDNRDAVKRLVRAWNRTVSALRRDPGPEIALLAETAGLSVPLAERSLAGVTLYGVEDNIAQLRGEYQKRFSEMTLVLARIDRERARGVPSANRFLALSALRQVAAGR